MQLTPREFDKLLIYMMAEIALKRSAKGIKLNYPEAVAIISAAALDGARAGQTIEEVTKAARTVLATDDVMEGVADMIPMVQVEAVFTDGSRLVTVHAPIQVKAKQAKSKQVKAKPKEKQHGRSKSGARGRTRR